MDSDLTMKVYRQAGGSQRQRVLMALSAACQSGLPAELSTPGLACMLYRYIFCEARSLARTNRAGFDVITRGDNETNSPLRRQLQETQGVRKDQAKDASPGIRIIMGSLPLPGIDPDFLLAGYCFSPVCVAFFLRSFFSFPILSDASEI
jgi:hypothetical protein